MKTAGLKSPLPRKLLREMLGHHEQPLIATGCGGEGEGGLVKTAGLKSPLPRKLLRKMLGHQEQPLIATGCGGEGEGGPTKIGDFLGKLARSIGSAFCSFSKSISWNFMALRMNALSMALHCRSVNHWTAAQRRKRLAVGVSRRYGLEQQPSRAAAKAIAVAKSTFVFAVAAPRLVPLAVLTRQEPHGGDIGHLLRQVPGFLFRSGTESV